MVAIAGYALLIYGLLMIVGGILGYKLPKKPSKISLIAGCASGAFAIVAYVISRFETTPGLAISLVVSAGVGVMMLPRLKTAKNPTSTGVIIALSAMVALLIVIALVVGP